MKSLQKRNCIVVILLLCFGVGFFVSKTGDNFDSGIVRDGCDMLNQGIGSKSLHLGREEHHQFNKHTGSRIVFEEYSQDEDLTSRALLAIDYYIVRDKVPNMDTMVDSVFSVEFGLKYKALSDSSFELLEMRVMPKATAVLTSLSNITITTEPLGTKQYGEPINGTLHMKLENGSWGIIYFFDWRYELVVDEHNHISLKLSGKPEVIV